MAKSPGVYITENDISTYSVADGGTTVAVVGYATKGAIGVPVPVSSYQKYVETFGSPTVVGYSGIAVKNIFSVGNSVIFYRVADESASTSRRVVKNAMEAVMGYQSFNKNTDVLVGTENYFNGKIYAVNVAESSLGGAGSKVFYVRSPMSGKLAISDVLGQLSSQIDATHGYHEIKLTNNYAKAGWYSFNFKVDADVDAAAVGGVSPAEIGSGDNVCSFVELTTADRYDSIKSKVETAALQGSNPVAVLALNKIGANPNYPVGTDTLGFDSLGGLTASTQFNVGIRNNTYTIDIPVSGTTTFNDLVESLNKALNAYGIFVLFELGTSSTDPTKIVFVSKTRGVGNYITVSPVPTLGAASAKQNLFLVASGSVPTEAFDGVEVAGKSYIYITDYFDIEGKATKKDSSSFRFSVELDPYTKGLKIVSVSTGPDSKIEMIDGVYGVSLLDQTVNGPVIGKVLTPIDGTAAVQVLVERDLSTKKIKFVSKTINAPLLTAFVETDDIGSLVDIIGPLDAATDGTPEISASEKDIVIAETVEKGSDTSKVYFEKVSIQNPVDGSESYVINIYYDGVLKETYSDITFDKNDVTRRFDIVINNTVENGGSRYLNFEFVKNEAGDIIQLEDGIYLVGKAMTSSDIVATDVTDLSDYISYDYSVGTNGIPLSGGEALFTDALDGAGELANTELYDYAILITPDNIDQSVQQAAVELAELRKDFIYVCDPPFGLTSDGVKRWHNGQGFGREIAVNSSYAAVYWPWVKLYDSYNKKYIWAPPSTVIASKYIDIDKVYGSWFAPAGETKGRLTVGDIEYSAKTSERDEIYTGLNRVNPIIKYNDGRTIIFGEKTCLRDNSALAKIHTRRMVLEIKKRVRQVLQSFLFLPNVAEVWGKASAAINAILEEYKRGGGLSYYNTVIDSTTVTAEMQQQDIMSGTIHIIPTGVIEDIEIGLNVDKVGETVTVS